MIDDPAWLLGILFAQSEDRARALAPVSEAGWRELLATCDALGTSGLLHAALRRTRCADLVPDDVRSALRLAHASNAAQNLDLGAEAKVVLDALASEGLVAAPMKGVALFVEGVVDDLGVRQTGDFDLVTRQTERSAVLRTLGHLGYQSRLDVVSWKHLPALWRGRTAVEVHEIAYWSAASRAVFGAEHLTVADRPTRIGRLCALQIHHLVLGSPPDAGLVMRTLADVDGFLRLARREPDILAQIVAACREAGLARELSAADTLLASARHEPRVLDLPSSAAQCEVLLAPLRIAPRGIRVEVLVHALRLLPVQPWEVTREMMSLVVFPPPELLAARLGGSPTGMTVTLARIRRPFELLVRVARALPGTVSHHSLWRRADGSSRLRPPKS